MAGNAFEDVAQIVAAHQPQILGEWLDLLKKAGALESGRIKEAELETQCRLFLDLLIKGMAQSHGDENSPAFDRVRDMLGDISRSRAVQGFTPTETASFIFSLKKPFLDAVGWTSAENGAALSVDDTWQVTLLLDRLGLYTMEIFQRTREDVIVRQSREIGELSTPVVRLWDGILALPLIGTVDSERTQVVMENLLQAIVEQGAEIAIVDITGVPTVDTLTAQHLIKTVAAARLMGADCIISGIRPQIAQTMVHLGVELNVTTKATLADALQLALHRLGKNVLPGRPEGLQPYR